METTGRKKRALLIRITLGLFFNITAFITVCVVNREIFIEGKTALGLFIYIVVFTVISYIAIEVAVWINCYADDMEDTDILTSMIYYRLYEIEFDVLVFFYTLVLSDWKLTEFTTATTCLASVDIVINIIMLGKNFYDVKDTECRFCYPLCFVMIPVIPIIHIVMKIRRP
ncbi:unnamed protein product [Mytilus edulis]|uniref:Uncharacterized protein n=1 Tax=Mytilus edulis TaxID=6550 RepID=A0A8S3SJH0_MYTED|nr:unnamed protein product [Mytilus edulis]